MRVIRKVFAILVCGGLAACANLVEIRQFAALSADSASYQSFVKDLSASLERRKQFEPGNEKFLEEQRKRRVELAPGLLAIHRSLETYMRIMASLAADETASFKSEVDAINEAALKYEFASEKQTAAVSALGKLLGIAVDLWRQRELQNYIEAGYGPFSTLLGDLLLINRQAYGLTLQQEQDAITRYFELLELEAGKNPAVLKLVALQRESKLQAIQDRRAKLAGYVKALEAIQIGHEKLYRERGKLSDKEVLIEARRYAREIRESMQIIRNVE